MDEGVMELAARGGNRELVKWLRGESCPWDRDTGAIAVDHGHRSGKRGQILTRTTSPHLNKL